MTHCSSPPSRLTIPAFGMPRCEDFRPASSCGSKLQCAQRYTGASTSSCMQGSSETAFRMHGWAVPGWRAARRKHALFCCMGFRLQQGQVPSAFWLPVFLLAAKVCVRPALAQSVASLAACPCSAGHDRPCDRPLPLLRLCALRQRGRARQINHRDERRLPWQQADPHQSCHSQEGAWSGAPLRQRRWHFTCADNLSWPCIVLARGLVLAPGMHNALCVHTSVIGMVSTSAR